MFFWERKAPKQESTFSGIFSMSRYPVSSLSCDYEWYPVRILYKLPEKGCQVLYFFVWIDRNAQSLEGNHVEIDGASLILLGSMSPFVAMAISSLVLSAFFMNNWLKYSCICIVFSILLALIVDWLELSGKLQM